MKTITSYIYYLLLRFALSLRYRIKIKGMENLKTENLPKKGGVLFLANHVAVIDPCILLRVFFKFKLHPVTIDYLFRKPFIRYFLDFVGALPIPNFELSSNSFKMKQIDETYARIFSYLNNKENLLIYPSGGLKNQAEEIIGGASGVHHILQNSPEANVVLVRTIGLWGSSFSRALTGKTPNLGKAFFHGLKVVLKNLIFFTPRRDLLIECALAPKDFPWGEDRLVLNRYLENWYNTPEPEPLKLVSFSWWKEDLPKPFERPQEEEISLSQVPEEIKNKILKEIASLSKAPLESIRPSHHLASDLGFDSLDMSQIVVILKDDFGISNVQSNDLTTVGSVFLYASKLKKGKVEDEEESEEENKGVWIRQKDRPEVFYPQGATIPEVFLKTCDRLGHYIACVDKIAGEVSYRKLKLGVILLAQAIQKLPGDRIGILMPASIAVNAAIIATMLANKIPVMVNWTLGERNLKSIVEQSEIHTTISSWNFLDRLDNVDLNGLDDQIVLLEEMRLNYTSWQKFTALLRSWRTPKSILKSFGIDRVRNDSVAAILFTSGTESVPKGVPLTHENVMENQKAAFQSVQVESSDVMLGILPSFHSFGFSVTGLFPLLAGLRVAYSPNPTDGRRLAHAIDRWRVTMLCAAPTFLKNLLRVAKPAQLRSLKLIVSGAEKIAGEIYEKMRVLNPKTQIIEGYGITECGPILTLNPIEKAAKGVGTPLPGVELKIVHPETHVALKEGEQGLILARGPNVFSGYLNPKLSSPFLEMEGKKWFVTGDLGFLDSQNYLTLSGRLKRFIKIGGEMVSLGAVEDVLFQSGKERGWGIDSDQPSLAVCALEKEGKKSEMHLFTTFDIALDEVNQTLRQSGMSNLIKIRSINKINYIPVLGTGKIDYKRLSARLESL